ncbi:MAG: hypothetical protein JOY77_09890 [Alphaproteobacteria bacterium]|nr:hypothetical protein [Alphaproteobacteria bacterium]MBV9063222.1 hypothetical protein [Alphaproteobacteria bacterium]
MWARSALTLLFFAGWCPYALAQSCGSAPIAPALASATEIKQDSPAAAAAAKHDAFVEIKSWQDELKSYRACMVSFGNEAKRQIPQLDPQKDADKLKRYQDQVKAADHAYDTSVDMEERVVNEFHAIQAAYCTRSDVDKSSCPK